MKFSELAPRERHNFVYFLLFFFFYYFIMSAYFPFFPVWLADVNHLTKTETGIVFCVYLVIRHYFSAGVRPDVG